jgi:hypothetical protein
MVTIIEIYSVKPDLQVRAARLLDTPMNFNGVLTIFEVLHLFDADVSSKKLVAICKDVCRCGEGVMGMISPERHCHSTRTLTVIPWGITQ